MLSLFRIPQPLRRKGLLCFRTGSSQCMTLLILCLLGIIVFTSKADLDTPKPFEDIIQSLGVNVDPLSYEPALSLQTLTMRYSSKRGRAPPPGFNQWYQYAKKEQCFLDRYDQIYRDLAPFWNMSQSEFKQRLMMLKDGPNLQEVSIVNGIMSINGPSVQSSTLKPIASFLPNMTFYVSNADNPQILVQPSKDLKHLSANPDKPWVQLDKGYPRPCHVHSKLNPSVSLHNKHGFLITPTMGHFAQHHLPLLSATKLDPCFADILVPSYQYFDAAARGSLGTNHPWESRHSRVYWRGTTTGGLNEGTTYKAFHRHRMVQFAAKNPKVYDVAFTNALQCEPKACEAMRKEYRFVPNAPFEDNFKFKYLIDMDGNSYSGRFLSFLFSGSLVFKATIFSEIHNDWLVPYVHYIPVEMDLSDLDAKVKWAMDNDAEANTIATNAQRFAERRLRSSQLHCYTYLLLLEFNRLLAHP